MAAPAAQVATVPRPVQYWSKGEWRSADCGVEDELKPYLLDVLSSENLVVLTGSGSSLEQSLRDAGSPSMEDLLERCKELDNYQVARDKFGRDPDDIEKFLSWCEVYTQIEQPEHELVEVFYQAAERKIRDLCDFVNVATPLDAHQTFLQRLVSRSVSLHRVQIFTTNYDRAFEEAATRSSMLPLDGFDFSSKPRFNGRNFDLDIVRRDAGRKEPEFVPGVFRLHKVHGSVDWDESGDEIVKTATPTDPAMIYPQSGKYEASYDTPFLDLMSRFQRALRQENLGLIVVGYGFRDRHLNNPLLKALDENLSLRLVVIDKFWEFEDGEANDKRTAHKRLHRLSELNPRLVRLVQAGFADFAKYLPYYMTPSERDQYERQQVRRP